MPPVHLLWLVFEISVTGFGRGFGRGCEGEQECHCGAFIIAPSFIFFDYTTLHADFVAQDLHGLSIAAEESDDEDRAGGGVREDEWEIPERSEAAEVVEGEGKVTEGAGEVCGEG